jgi:hypothetical protein
VTWQLSTSGGDEPRWSRDGRELFYLAPDFRLMAVRIGLDAKEWRVDTGIPVSLV